MSGQKVTPSNPPTTQEATGTVAPTSLAAESVQAGGAFAANKNTHTHHTAPLSSTATANLTSTAPHLTPAEIAAAATENKGVDKAPTYVNVSAGVRGAEREGEGKVHGGRGVVEDEDMVGRPARFEAEVGTGGVGRGGGSGGGAVGGGEGERGGAFDALGSEEA